MSDGIKIFLSVPVSLLSSSDFQSLRERLPPEEWEIIELTSTNDGQYEIAGDHVSHISLVERLEDLSRTNGRSLLFSLGVETLTELLKISGLVETFQKIALYGERARRIHLNIRAFERS